MKKKIHDSDDKVQIQRRLKKARVPVDKLTQRVFGEGDNIGLTVDEYIAMIRDGEYCFCNEKIRGKDVETPFRLELEEGFKNELPPDPFTREVLFSAISAYEDGLNTMTISMTLDALTGGEEKHKIQKRQFEEIHAAFKRLAFTGITVKLTPLLEACPTYRKNYHRDGTLTGALLPCKFLGGEVNGKKALVIKMLDESPLMTVARMKKQIMTYDLEPLAIKGQKNTPQIMTIKNYLLRRIELMKQRNQTPSIKFNTLYKNCGLADASDSTKQNARKIIVDTLKAFVSDGVIKDFEFVSELGRKYQRIKITFYHTEV